MNLWLLVGVLGIAFGQDFQDFLDEVESDYKLLGVAAGAFSLDQPGWLLRGNLGRRMAEDSTPIQDSDRFALNDAGRSMVAALVARILEDPQLGDEQINLSWTTTVGEVFHDTGVFNVNPAYYNSTLLDLLVFNGRIPDERGAYEVDAALDFIDSMWTRSNYSEGSQNGNVEMRRETAQFILENPGEVPGKGTYSEYSYSIAVSMLEYVLHDDFDNLLSRYVFEPLDMVGCTVGPTTLDPSLPPVEPWSHFAGPWGVYNLPITPSSKAAPPSAIAPDAGLVCPLDAIKNFLVAHLARSDSFLSAESWDLLHSKQGELNTGYGRNQPYAPGFKIIEQEDGKIAQLYHDGTDGKSYSLVYINLQGNVGIIQVGNTPIEGGMVQEVGWSRIVEYMAAYIGLGDDDLKQLLPL